MDITPQQPEPSPAGKPKAAASGNKRPRSKRAEGKTTALVATPTPQPPSGSESSVKTAAQRESVESSLMEDMSGMIATAAYYLAERRNFAPGHELDDWLEAEQQLRK